MASFAVCATVAAALVAYAGCMGSAARGAAALSAKLTVPQGGAQLAATGVNGLVTAFAGQSGGTQPEEDDSASRASSASSPAAAPSSSVSSQAASSPQTSSAAAGKKPVKTAQYTMLSGSEYETYGKICVYNQTAHHSADIAKQLSIRPDVHINLKAAPQVLIVHTHTTESYASSDTGFYDPNAATRNTDKSKSVVKVGDEIAASLEKSGIGVIHDTTYNDYPDYNGAYDRSLAVIENNLKKYPSIKVVLDIHRDSIQYTDGTRVKPTAVVNGKKAAQVMVVAACDEAETSLSVPDWQYNYRFALRIQQQLVTQFPGLARPLNLCPRRYNMQASHGSLLVEFGTDVNTLDEAAYAGELFGQSLAQVLLGLQG